MQDASAVRTVKLYYEDAYRTEFDAVILTARKTEEEGAGAVLDVVLDRTCFFPEEGGQSPDRGVLAGLEVTDVQILDGDIHHFLAYPHQLPGGEIPEMLSPGRKVEGQIDWAYRFSNMQQHSGEHLFSGIVHQRYGFENVGFHLGAGEVTLDFDGVIPAEDLPEIEREANRAVWSNLPSVVRMTTYEERQDLVYRSKLDLKGEVRIVTFPGIDSCACCAPHVRRTGEIGIVKAVSMIRWKGGVRVSILCGGRALAFLQQMQDIVQKTAGFLTTSAENVYPQVGRLKEEVKELSARVKAAAAKDLIRRAEALPEGTENAALTAEEADAAAVREAVNAMMKRHEGFCGIFTGAEGKGYSFVIGSRTKDCRELCAHLRECFGARGGGKPEMVQGSVNASESELLELFRDRS